MPRFVGNAVVRNRLKRWTRDFLRVYDRQVGLCTKDGEKSGESLNYDVNIVFRKRNKEFYRSAGHKEVDTWLSEAFRRFDLKRAQN